MTRTATWFVERLPRFAKDEQSLGGVAQSLCQHCAQKQAQHLDFDLCSKGRASRNRGATSADCCRPDSPETREEVQASGKNIKALTRRYRHGHMANGVEEYLQGISHNLARF
jgi:hypothetical protein